MERVCDYAFRCIRLVEVLVKQGQEVRPFMSRRGKVASWLLRSTNLRLPLGSDWRCRYVHACCLFCWVWFSPWSASGFPVTWPQVSDLSSKLREMRQYWTQLSAALCDKLAAGGANQEKCWNGITKARWGGKLLREVVTLTEESQAWHWKNRLIPPKTIFIVYWIPI